MSAQTPYIRLAHLPYAEETEDVIHTVSIEIILHLLEAGTPPSEVILCHLIPVIGRESPVLSADGEIIGRRTCGSVEVEELRINGCIHGVRTDTDRYIALHGYTNRVGISHSVRQLLVGMELEVFIEFFRLFVAFAQELGIGLQPSGVLCFECLVFVGSEERILVLLEEGFEEDHLRVVYILVVRDAQSIEFGFLCLIFLLLRRREFAHFLDIDVYRMEGKDGNGVVWITVEVIMTQRGIVDRQGLDHLLTCSSSPVRHFLEVLELTDTESFFGTQREDGYCHTGSFPTRLCAAERTVVLEDCYAFIYAPDLAVLTPFGIYYGTGFEVIDDVFIFDDILAFYLYISAPDRELGIAHDELLVGIPFTQCLAVTDDRDALRRQDLRQVNRETDTTLFLLLRRLGLRMMTSEQRFGKSGGVETILVCAGLPCVANVKVFVLGFQRQRTRFAGLVDILAFPHADSILVLDGACKILHGYISRPEIRTLTVQYKRILLGPSQNRFLRLYDAQILPILGAITNLKFDIHGW